MQVSVFDLFSIGIGPSSSHTVGPMRAAYRFTEELIKAGLLTNCHAVVATTHGSLAWTGHGHSTDKALLVGLSGKKPETVSPEEIRQILSDIDDRQQMKLAAEKFITFDRSSHLIFDKKKLLPKHSNGMHFQAFDDKGTLLIESIYYSVGGGFVLKDEEFVLDANKQEVGDDVTVKYPFKSARELLEKCEQNNITIAALMFANEAFWRESDAVNEGLLAIWQVMDASIQAGCKHEGLLPGKLKVKRRAPGIYEKLINDHNAKKVADMNWLSVYAIAVNEENAAGGRVVTAPTNGAAGIIPSVLKFALQDKPEDPNQTICDFLLTSAAVGMLYKENASISAAEVGCQGEVGVACSMAAAGYAAVLGGSLAQIENAAEIAMEHHLGLTCDPIAGLVQIPCIERNAMGAVQAVNAARLALLEDGQNKVSLDEVIDTMRQTGKDMLAKYKETSQGGLAVNVPEC